MPNRVVAADVFTNQRQQLWDLCYRVTGNASDADALLATCFSRTVDQPGEPDDADWRGLLVRSAAMLAVETLRQRKYRNYVGPWLPSLIETGNAASSGPRRDDSRSQYDLVESGSIAFLRALEALDPRERLMFVLCDALGHDPIEIASTLEVPVTSVRTPLQTARRAMEHYDSTNVPPTREVQARTAEALQHCLSHIEQHHAGALEKMCMPDVEALFDSGGEFVAPLGPIRGAGRVARLLVKFVDASPSLKFSFRMLNGLPAALGTSTGRPRWAERLVLRVEAQGGRISDVHVILATAKLAAVRFD